VLGAEDERIIRPESCRDNSILFEKESRIARCCWKTNLAKEKGREDGDIDRPINADK